MSKIKKVFIIIGAAVALVVVVQVINASKYKMQVNIVEGENIMGLNPLTDKLDFGDLARNNGMTRYVNLQNNGSFSVYFAVWKFGEIAGLVKMSKNFFTLRPGEELKLAFELNVLPSAEIKQYSGTVVIFRFPKFF